MNNILRHNQYFKFVTQFDISEKRVACIPAFVCIFCLTVCLFGTHFVSRRNKSCYISYVDFPDFESNMKWLALFIMTFV